MSEDKRTLAAAKAEYRKVTREAHERGLRDGYAQANQQKPTPAEPTGGTIGDRHRSSPPVD